MSGLTFAPSATYNSMCSHGEINACPEQGALGMTAIVLQSEEAVQGRIRKQQLIESLEHMSPTYLEGIKRILTVSADTELISAPAYYNAAVHAPSLNAFGTAVSIIQDELGHAHIAYRLLRDLGVDTEELIFERPA